MLTEIEIKNSTKYQDLLLLRLFLFLLPSSPATCSVLSLHSLVTFSAVSPARRQAWPPGWRSASAGWLGGGRTGRRAR